MLEMPTSPRALKCPLAGFFDGDVRRAAEDAIDQARRGDVAASST